MKLFKNQEKKQKKPKKDFMDTYKTIAFHAVGWKTKKQKTNENLSIKLKKADLSFTPELYHAVILFTLLLVVPPSLLLFYFIFNIIIQSSQWILYTLALTAITAIFAGAYFPFVVQSKISNRKQHINKELPFALSELSILASTGLTPIKIFRQIAQRDEQSTLTNEFKKIVYKTDIEGKDLITALSESAKESPSDEYREALWDIANMIHQGGDLDVYLRDKADTSMQLKRNIQKEFIEKLGTYSEMYISLVLVGILFIGIAAFIMDAMGATMAGLNSESLLLALTYGLIPLAVIAVNIIVSMSYSKSG
jgi:archaeal flagellar protein FlaJ